MRKFFKIEGDGSISDIESPCLCQFGILESIAAFAASALTSVGVGAETAGIIGSAATDALTGGVIGAITDPKKPLKGAEFGAIGGGVGGLVAPTLADFGLGGVGGAAAAGAIGGGIAGAATGRNPLTSALEGGAAGGISSALGISSPSTPTGGPGTSAASATPPPSVPTSGGAASDVTITGGGAPPTGNFSAINNDFGPMSPTAGGSIGGTIPAASTATGFTPQPVTVTPQVSGGGSNPGGATSGAPAVSDSGISGWLDRNRWAPGAALIGLDAIKGNQALPGQKALEASAAQMAGQGAQLESYLRSGTLPPGLDAGLKEATAAAEASIRSTYAAAGDSGSSAEMQDIAAVRERAQAQGAQMAISLLQQGVSETNMADQLYMQLMGEALQQDQALGTSIANFAASLVPGGGTPPAKPAG